MLRAATLRGRCPPSRCVRREPCLRPRRCRHWRHAAAVDLYDAVFDEAIASSSERSTSWPSASTTESASRVSNSPVGCALLVVELHLLDGDRGFAGLLDGRQPLDQHAFLQRFLELGFVRGHLLARAPVDDDRLGRAQALRRARHVECGVASAVSPATRRPSNGFSPSSMLRSTATASSIFAALSGRDIGALGDMCADREEHGVEPALGLRLQDVRRLRAELGQAHRGSGCAALPLHPVLRAAAGSRDAEAHHAARHRTRLPDRHRVPNAQVVCRGPVPTDRADDQHLLAGQRLGRIELPSPDAAPRRRGSARWR